MRRRLVTTSLALVLAALVAFAIPLGIAVRSQLEGRALDSLQTALEPLALGIDVTSRTCAELQLRVAQFGGGPAVLTVIGGGGVVVTTTAADGRPVVGDEVLEAAQGRPGRLASDGRLAVAVPLTTDVCARPLLLHAAQPDDELRRGVTTAWAAIAGVAAVVAAVAAASAWWLARQLAAPFEALTASARRLGSGDFSARAPRSGLPEADAIADALDGTAARLARAVERSAAFTADASHQLRTPLTALRLQLESLVVSPTARDAVAAALDETDRLEATIDDLVTLTRVDAPEIEVDLGDIIDRRLPAWRALAEERGRTVVAELLPSPAVRIRPEAIVQAVQVLLDNALEHGRGTVTVRVAPARPDEPDVAVRVCVADAGPGPDGVTERPGGRGLPLARALVAAEGGRLTVTGAGGGTRVCLVVPVRRG